MTTATKQFGRWTTFTYDAAGQRTAIQNARGHRTTFEYDDAGRLNDQIDPLGRRTTFQYDKAGRQTLRIDGKGRRTTYVYDDAGQQTSRQYQDGTRVTQSYDDVGRRTVMWDSTGRTTTVYDNIGRVTRVTNPAGKIITYLYDNNNQRTETFVAGSGVDTFSYDDAGRLTSIRNFIDEYTTYTYDNADRRTSIERANGTRTSIIYDNASQVKEIYHRNSGGSILTAFTYTYDNAGTRTSVAEPGSVGVLWDYDNAYRLVREERTGGSPYTDTFTYDDVGNRTTWEDVAGATTYTYDAADQLETAVKGAARTTYTYDANGNLEVENASGTRTTHTWNDENQLTQVAKTGMTTNQYTFNGDGQRVAIVDSQGTKKPIWDFENVLLETDGSNVTQVIYTLEPAGYGKLVSQRRSGTSSFFLYDALGSTRKLTNSAGSVSDSYDFKAYGETFASSGSTVNVFRWVGELGYYLDIDRLAYYLRARPYNPKIARFLSQDPLGFVGSKWNLYEYVRSLPTVLIDPSGLVILWTETGPAIPFPVISRPIRPTLGTNPGGVNITTANSIDCIYFRRVTIVERVTVRCGFYWLQTATEIRTRYQWQYTIKPNIPVGDFALGTGISLTGWTPITVGVEYYLMNPNDQQFYKKKCGDPPAGGWIDAPPGMEPK